MNPVIVKLNIEEGTCQWYHMLGMPNDTLLVSFWDFPNERFNLPTFGFTSEGMLVNGTFLRFVPKEDN